MPVGMSRESNEKKQAKTVNPVEFESGGRPPCGERHNQVIYAYFIVIEYAASEHSGAEQCSQLIFPLDAVLRAATILPIIWVKSNLPSTQSRHKQFILNEAELPGEKLIVRDNGFASAVLLYSILIAISVTFGKSSDTRPASILCCFSFAFAAVIFALRDILPPNKKAPLCQEGGLLVLIKV
jgi:hypothetical protein